MCTQGKEIPFNVLGPVIHLRGRKTGQMKRKETNKFQQHSTNEHYLKSRIYQNKIKCGGKFHSEEGKKEKIEVPVMGYERELKSE